MYSNFYTWKYWTREIAPVLCSCGNKQKENGKCFLIKIVWSEIKTFKAPVLAFNNKAMFDFYSSNNMIWK